MSGLGVVLSWGLGWVGVLGQGLVKGEIVSLSENLYNIDA